MSKLIFVVAGSSPREKRRSESREEKEEEKEGECAEVKLNEIANTFLTNAL